MREAIEANPDVEWRIAVWHHSIYSSARHSINTGLRTLRSFFVPVLQELEIDVVLLGHDHSYTRTHQMIDNEPQPEQTVGDPEHHHREPQNSHPQQWDPGEPAECGRAVEALRHGLEHHADSEQRDDPEQEATSEAAQTVSISLKTFSGFLAMMFSRRQEA